jgi:hypothetical protein
MIEMQLKHSTNFIRYFCFIGVFSALMACNQMPATQPHNDSTSKVKSMSVSDITDTESRAIPPIDVSQSSIFETATFGLG